MGSIQEENVSGTVVVHLDPTLRAEMEAYSEKTGESLDTFISRASAALLERLKAQEWYDTPRHSTTEGRALAIGLLRRPSGNSPLPGDELPKGCTDSMHEA